MAMTFEEAQAQLTGPGGLFEVVSETVAGRPMKNWKNRERSLREKVANCGMRGDAAVHGPGRAAHHLRRVRAARLRRGRARSATRTASRRATASPSSPSTRPTGSSRSSARRRAGGIGVGLNGWWATEEIEYGLTDSGSRFLVVDERLWPRVAPLVGKIDALEKVFYIGENAPAGTIPIAELLEPAADGADRRRSTRTIPFVLLYTSGTTGRSKGCITTHRGTIAQVIGIVFASVVGALTRRRHADPAGGRASSRALLTSPLFHVGGLHSGVCTRMTAGGEARVQQRASSTPSR